MKFFKIIFIIALIALTIFILWVLLTHRATKKRIVNEFKHNNVIVFGKKGKGKDVLFQMVINARDEPYFANIPYGGAYRNIAPKDLELCPNDYRSFISGNITQIKKNNKYENHDIYFSDVGNILPCQYDSLLYKQYPSFPITYSLSRHLYNNNIHCNTQSLDRPWKALREQADYYIKCRGVIKLPFFLIVKTTEYDKYLSASQSLLPVRVPLTNRHGSKIDVKQYNATNGFIKNGFVIVRKTSIYYDTRAFHKILFGRKAPKN